MIAVIVVALIIIVACVVPAFICPLCGAHMKMYSSTRQGYFTFYCPKCKKDFILKGWR